ncbi:Methyltransferase domain [Seminavis robusta]|uniref:Methyltransferase domain n=1 Tax=Seminavis robusta TaxID=568900 RepID=A0A9N8HLX6_9STRA|nr:Methyltransferase domain [Seminavis robusta]|eukprot:Sro851_g210840.1 Methyltransferase domain (223) ;mRNA; f:11144-11812
MIQALFKKVLISALAPSMRSPSGFTGYFARKVMRKSNPVSTQVGIQRLDLQPSDVFVELGGGEGAGIKAVFDQPDKVPSMIHLVEISEDFRAELTRVIKEDLPQTDGIGNKIEIHGEDCKQMPYLQDNSVSKMFGMNVVYFLDPLPEYLNEIHRVLKPGGVVVFGCKFKNLPKDDNVFINVEEQPITRSMEAAGFQVGTAFVEVSADNPVWNYLEVKGVKSG